MKTTALGLLLVTVCTAAFAAGAPSTPEQRAWVVETTRWLEQNPLHADAKKRSAEVLRWWIEVPDLTLSVCPMMIETKNKKISPTAVSVAMFSAGAYMIEHPTATRAEIALGGVEGALRAYTNALAADSRMRDEFLDSLVAKQKDGTLLADYVTPLIANCDAAERAKKR